MINSLTIIGGYDKFGEKEPVRKVKVKKGEIVGVVGPTGSGKSSLIYDIEQLAQGDTFSKRKILVNDKKPSYEYRVNPKKKLVAHLSQHMNFLADMSVEEFLKLHAKCRNVDEKRVDEVIDLANKLTGEPIKKTDKLTILSGGQSRALMVADIALISKSPIVVIDEIENAGIKKHEALNVLTKHGKIIFIVTHDPTLVLNTDKRIVMKNGGMQKIIKTTKKEKNISQKLNEIDELLLDLREKVRLGKKIENVPM